MTSISNSKSSVWLAYACGILTVVAAAAGWQALTPRTAYAQAPETGAQRNEIVAELKISNQKLGEILAVLKEVRDLGVPGKVAPVRSPVDPPRK